MFLKVFPLFILVLLSLSCSKNLHKETFSWKPYDETSEIIANKDHEISRMRYKLVQSKFLDKNEVFKSAIDQLSDFSEANYIALKPFIYEKSILEIQSFIDEGSLSYEKLVQWYLFRILQYESNPRTTLHSIISINPNAVKQAKELDNNKVTKLHPIFGMPILLKDNINATGMATTAGAYVLKDNQAEDAHIVRNLKSKGAIILGKVNLSEWAYFFCSGCPVGYSAIGGQTLNPYGRKIFETGGSSSGSGTTMAANYAVAAVGTETSGSILSPSSMNSVVGLKPTIGLLSRSGIVPISSTLDTPGPMTRWVSDNAILLSAMTGEDAEDPITIGKSPEKEFYKSLQNSSLKAIKLGALSSYMERDSVYRSTIEYLQRKNVEIVILSPERIQMDGFVSILNIDMKNDLPVYLQNYADRELPIESVQDVITFNRKDTALYAPYGQGRLEGILDDNTTKEELSSIKQNLQRITRKYFDDMMDNNNLDAVLSINNYGAGYAAAAKYPALTIPMGYRASGQPVNLTFIGKPFSEELLLQIGYAFEQMTQYRRPPKDYAK